MLVRKNENTTLTNSLTTSVSAAAALAATVHHDLRVQPCPSLPHVRGQVPGRRRHP